MREKKYNKNKKVEVVWCSMPYAHTPALQTRVSIPELAVDAHHRAQQRVLFPLQQEVEPVLLQLYAGGKKFNTKIIIKQKHHQYYVYQVL